MNPFDLTILHFLNSFAGQAPAFDSIAVFFTDNAVLEGGLILVLFWAAWGQEVPEKARRQQMLLFSIIASSFAVLAARILARILPYRVRPLQNPPLDFKLPYSMDHTILIGWSSFPSDHAVLFFCLAMGLWFVSRRMGTVALVYALIGSSLSRVYTGIHYPTDVLAGMAMGIGIAYLVKVDRLRNAVTQPVLNWRKLHPGAFIALLYILTFQLTTEFGFARSVFHEARQLHEIVSLDRRQASHAPRLESGQLMRVTGASRP